MKYDAITLDTVIFTNNGYALEHGLLAQLTQFKQGSVKFILSEIVAREIWRHITEENKEIRTNLDKAINRAKNKRLLIKETADQLLKLTQAESTPEMVTKKRFESFKKDTGLEIIEAQRTEIGKLVELYFKYGAPFENKAEKKHEFPDAIALLSLEQYAKEKNLRILAVSRDKGWMEFAKSSNWIDVYPDFTNALSLIQEHKEQANEIASNFLNKLFAGEYPEFDKIIEQKVCDSVSELEVYAEADSYLRNEEEHIQVDFKELSYNEGGDFSIVQIGNDFMVIELPISVSASASADFSFYVWDSIDKEEIYMGGNTAQVEIEFDAALLISIKIDSSCNTPQIEKIELIKTPDSIDFGEIEPDYSSDYYEE